MVSSYELNAERESKKWSGKKWALVVVGVIALLFIILIVVLEKKKLPSYKLTNSDGTWVQEGPNQYTCHDAAGVDLKGNNGDFANYCIFDKESDAQAACNADSKCLGYSTNPSDTIFQLTRMPPVPNPVQNGRFFTKQT